MTESARVYDLDGTLVHLDVDWTAAERDVRDLVAEADLAVDPEREGVWDLLDLAHEHGIGEAVESQLASHEVEGAERSDRLTAADDLETFPGPIAVCSLNCEEACRIALERHDLTQYVDAVVGRDSVGRRKPHPEPLLEAVRALSAAPVETLFVGDSESDAVCAERAGTQFTYVGGRPPDL